MMRRSGSRNVSRLLGAWLLAGAVFALSSRAQEAPEPYLHGPQGPYRGRVVEATTERPIADALVVFIWQREDVQIDGFRNFVAAREGATDPTGTFVLEADAIETTPPFLARPPRVIIYAPGYLPFPETRMAPGGASSLPFRGDGMVVALRPARTEEDRIRSFNTFIALLSRFRLFEVVEAPPPSHPPLGLVKQAIREEFAHFGFVERGGLLEHKDQFK